ncbi:hypothetical protein OSB04_027702 [Centaurea solstitialis]|uniref:RRM domain-containing protein n=1 Tax=Centaurea solstitialis TaxID=347529 RepID=A0AA38SRA7_9ASTR|nr:hypothetical protein OSB04_027702 [Centaurea solstitialis]
MNVSEYVETTEEGRKSHGLLPASFCRARWTRYQPDSCHVNPNALRSHFAKFGEIEDGPLGIDTATGKFKGFAMFVYKTVEGCKKALEEPNKVFNGCQLQCRQAVDGQRANKNTKSFPLVTPAGPGNLQQSDIANLAYGYGGLYPPQLMNPAAGIMVGQNPMLVPALNQNSISQTPQSFGISGGYGINTVSPSMIASYGSQLGLPSLGAYQNSQAGRSSGGTTSAAPAARQQSGVGSLGANFPSYLSR